jgi:vitamin B12 transporter
MKTLSIVHITASLILASISLTADSLTGKLTDPKGAAVAAVDITLYERASGNIRKSRSSDTGEYNFVDISAGVYLMEAQASNGALNFSKEVTVSGSSTENVTLSIAQSVVRVLVTATGTPISEQEVGKSVDVIDAEQIANRDEYNVGEVLRTMPGIQIQTQTGGVTQIRTHGLPNQYTAVLIDGLRFRDASATQGDSSGFVSDMNVTDLSRVEFMRGSGSDLYGTNAIGGTINLNSNEGGGTFHGAFRAEGGGLGMARETLNISGGLHHDRFVYSAGAAQLNITAGVRGETPNKNSSGQFFGKYYFTPKISLSARVWGSNSWQRSVDSPAFPATVAVNVPATGIVQAIALSDSQMTLYEQKKPFVANGANFVPGVPDPDSNRTSSFDATAIIFRDELTSNTSWRASYQRVNSRRDYYDGPAGAGSFEPVTSQISTFDGTTDEAQVRIDNRNRFGQLTGGYEFEREAIDSTGARNIVGGTIVRTTAQQVSHSLYGQNQFRFLKDRLQIVLGGRIQFFNLDQPSFTGATSPYEKVAVSSPETAYTGDVSIAYFVPASSTKFRAHLGNGYRAPSLYERFGSGGGTNGAFTYYGDPRLPAEKSLSFEGGIDQYLFHNRARLSGTFFYTDLSQTILFTTLIQPDPFGRVGSGYRNSVGGGIARGEEFSMQISPTRRTQVIASYTHNNSETRAPNSGTYDALRTARHIGSIMVTQSLTKRLNVTLDFYGLNDVIDSAFIGSGSRVIAYPSVKKTDVMLNYRVPLKDRSLDLYTKWENIFNLRYTDSGFLAPGAWGIAGMKFNF